MARHKKKQRLRYLQAEEIMSPGALAVLDVFADQFTQTVNEKVYAVYAKGTWSHAGATSGEGPVSFGFAHGDYSAAEIEECLEQTASWLEADRIGQERRRRQVRRVGVMSYDNPEGVFKDGEPVFTKLGFYLESGETLQTWCRQQGGAPLTTGSSIHFSGIIAVRRL